MRRASMLVVALLCAASCKEGNKSSSAAVAPAQSHEGPAPSEEQIIGLTRGLDAIAMVERPMQVALLAQLLHETVAPDDLCFAGITEVSPDRVFDVPRILACARPCNVDAEALAQSAPETRMPAIRTQCKDTDLGIPEDHADLITPELLLIARAARILATTHARAPEALKAVLTPSMSNASLHLPMPAWTQDYRLPSAPVAAAGPIAATQYLIITDDGQSLREAPIARFTVSGLRIDFPPGEAVAAAEPKPAEPKPAEPTAKTTEPRQQGQYAMKKSGEDPTLARDLAIEAALNNGILGATASISGLDGAMAPPATVILADGQVQAARLVEFADQQGGAVLGVTAQSASAAGLTRLVWDTRPMDLIVAITDSDTWVSSMPTGDHRQIPRAGERIDLEAVREVLREFRASSSMIGTQGIAVHVSGKVSYRELVDVIAGLDQNAPAALRVRAQPPGPELPIRPRVRPGVADAPGNLDKDVIRRFIRRNLPRMRFCYESKLLENPDLAGTTTVDFVITAEGKTTTVKASGFHPDVDACVARAVEAIVFPKPEGGGVVKVSYPFVFKTGK